MERERKYINLMPYKYSLIFEFGWPYIVTIDEEKSIHFKFHIEIRAWQFYFRVYSKNLGNYQVFFLQGTLYG